MGTRRGKKKLAPVQIGQRCCEKHTLFLREYTLEALPLATVFFRIPAGNAGWDILRIRQASLRYSQRRRVLPYAENTTFIKEATPASRL
jgi:hypothetical protein